MRELKVVSVGELVLKARVNGIHSSFTHAVNLFCQTDFLISLVTENVGAGPNNIVLNLESLEHIHDIFIDNETLWIDEESFALNECHLYDSSLIISDVNAMNFLSNINVLEKIINKQASPFSVAFLLDERREAFFITQFEISVKDTLKKEFCLFLKGDLSAISRLKGVGVGLTPQGDDLILGALIAIAVYEHIFHVDVSELKSKMLGLLKTSNLISYTSLFLAANNKFYEREKKLINSLAYDNNSIYNNALEILQIGETSGGDFATGFILTTKKIFEGGIIWQ